MKSEEFKKGIEGIKEKITYKPPDLIINRVPKITLLRFKELGRSDEFVGDYGFLLKYLVDVHDGIINTGIEHLEEGQEILNRRLEALETKPEEKKTRTMCDGKKMEEKKNE